MKPYIPEKLPLKKIDWDHHVELVGKANASLARYDGILQSIVNPSVLLSPIITQEAVISSRIEGTQASLEDVLQYQAKPKEKIAPEKAEDIQEVINYRKAMMIAIDEMEKRPMCLNLIRHLHSILLKDVRGSSSDPGEFRRVQNYIAPAGKPIEEATFIPPSPERVLPALDNWEKYIHSREKDPIVQLAIVKAQFELIHPFLDGNGRIGRMLVPIFLYTKRVLISPMFYISAYLDRNRDTYFERLNAVSNERDWSGWIDFFLQGVMIQAEDNIIKARAILQLYDEMKQSVPDITRSQYAVQTIDLLFSLPVFSTTDFIENTSIPKRSAMRILKALREKGKLVALKEGRGSRPAVLMFPELISIVQSDNIV